VLLLPGRRARSLSRCCSFLAAALTEIYLCDVSSCQDILRSIAEQVAAHAERLSITRVVWGGDFNM
jgi:hypothetical protein